MHANKVGIRSTHSTQFDQGLEILAGLFFRFKLADRPNPWDACLL